MNELTGPSKRKTWLDYLSAMPPSILISAIWIIIMILVAVFADLIAPYDYKHMDLLDRLRPPIWLENGTWSHVLGTDDLGRDVLSRIMFSIRISLFVALLGTFIGAVLGTSLGFAAAHFRGRVDDLIMILIDFQAALPFLILALAVLAFFENSFLLFVLVMGIYGWERYARIVRQFHWLCGFHARAWRYSGPYLPSPHSA
jgi:peptide/nickel transport system permease protein